MSLRILLTGATSFTGCWFAKQLADAGHFVSAAVRRRRDAYRGLQDQRLRILESSAHQHAHGCVFGSEPFMGLIETVESWDLLCHHAAHTTDYKSAEFDVMGAVASNTRNMDEVLHALHDHGCKAILLTGSYFEEGEGGKKTEALSPYGLSKTLTRRHTAHCAQARKMQLGNFVIPNPFGPLEEPRFTSHLISCWMRREPAVVKTPDYVRDNIHVSLLAKSYVAFAEELVGAKHAAILRPSGYAESQGAFALRFAEQMRKRLDLPCELDLAKQSDFSEPMQRTNSDKSDAAALGWSESKAWDDLASYYLQTQPQ